MGIPSFVLLKRLGSSVALDPSLSERIGRLQEDESQSKEFQGSREHTWDISGFIC